MGFQAWLFKKLTQGGLAAVEDVMVKAIPFARHAPSAFVQKTFSYAISNKIKQRTGYSIFGSSTEEDAPLLDIHAVELDNEEAPIYIISNPDFAPDGKLKLPDDIQKEIGKSEKNIHCIIDREHKYRDPKAKTSQGIVGSTYDTAANFVAIDMTESAGWIMGSEAGVACLAKMGGAAIVVGSQSYWLIPAEVAGYFLSSYIGSCAGGVVSKKLLGERILKPLLNLIKKYTVGSSKEKERPVNKALLFSDLNKSSSSKPKEIKDDWELVEASDDSTEFKRNTSDKDKAKDKQKAKKSPTTF